MAELASILETGEHGKFDQNFELHVGQDHTQSWTIQTTAGGNVDASAFTITFAMNTHPLSGESATLSLSGTGADGSFTVAFTDTAMDAVNPGIYYYDVKAVDGSSLEHTVCRGNIIVHPSLA